MYIYVHTYMLYMKQLIFKGAITSKFLRATL